MPMSMVLEFHPQTCVFLHKSPDGTENLWRIGDIGGGLALQLTLEW